MIAIARSYSRPARWDEVAVRRVGAALVDLVLACWVTALATIAVRALDPVPTSTTTEIALAVLVVGLPWACFVIPEGAAGATVGKRLLGLEVRAADGSRPGWPRALVRQLLRLSPVAWAGVARAAVTGASPWHDDCSATSVTLRNTRDGTAEARRRGAGGWSGPRPSSPGRRGDARHRQRSVDERRLRLVPPMPSAVAARTPASGIRPPDPALARPAPDPALARPAPDPALARPAPDPALARPLRPRRPGRVAGPVAGRVAEPVAGRVAEPVAGRVAEPVAGRVGPPAGGPWRLRLVSGADTAPVDDAAGERSGSCRCQELPRLTGDDAVRYACGHLLAVRRWPRAGCFALVCPTTRVAWLAHDEWADRSGEATLVRLAELPDPLPSRPRPAPAPANG